MLKCWLSFLGAKVALPGNLASDRAVLPESWGDYP